MVALHEARHMLCKAFGPRNALGPSRNAFAIAVLVRVEILLDNALIHPNATRVGIDKQSGFWICWGPAYPNFPNLLIAYNGNRGPSVEIEHRNGRGTGRLKAEIAQAQEWSWWID